MTSKTMEEDHLQVVFLIDENTSRDFGGGSAENALKCVPLCVLRILSHFYTRYKSRFHWGYKFYSSSSLTHRYERHSFQEFCIAEFENFEKNLNSRLGETLKSFEEQQQQQSLASTSTNSSKCLTCALTEVLHDFQWKTNDINSPLKPTRRKRSSRIKHNVVFLVSSCPKSLQSLEAFLGRNKEDSESFQSAFMSNALFKEFVDIYRINLYWIDTTHSENSVESKVINMINTFLQLLHGRIIPFQAVVNTFDHHLQPSQVNGQLLPVTSVLNHYIKIPNKIDENPCGVGFDLPNHCGASKWRGFLCSEGTPPKVHCNLQLSPMLSTPSDTTNSLHPNTKLSLAITNDTDSVTCHTIQLSHNTHTYDIQSSETKSPNIFWIKGVVRRDKVCPTWFHLSKVFSCIAVVSEPGTECDGESTGSALSGWFQRLMVSLSRQNLLLVIEMKDPLTNIPVSGVLQPLTSLCGTINIISTDGLVVIEKLLLWNEYQQAEDNCKDILQIGNLKMPVIESDNSSRAPTQCEIHSSLVNHNAQEDTDRNIDEDSKKSHNDKSDNLSNECSKKLPKVFSMQDLNSWSLGLACLQPGTHLVGQKAGESNKEDPTTNESSLIKKLKELYSKKKASSKTKTPKKLKKQHLSKESVSKKQKTRPNTRQKESQKSTTSTHLDSNESMEKDKPEQDKIQELLATLELNDEADMKTFLKDAYSQAVSQIEAPSEFIDKAMAVIQWYNDKQPNTDKKVLLQPLLDDTLLMDNLSIRDKYEGKPDSKETKLQEYQIQVILRLEIVSSMGDAVSPLVDEVVVMLRSISFIKDPGFLRDFLREVIIVRYVDRIPKFLFEIYEGLMLDLPSELLSPSKQEEDESPLKRCHVSVVRPESDQPRSESSRPLTRHRSIADIGGKRRQIVVPGKAKTKKKHKNVLSSAQRNDHHKVKVQKTPVKKVRRNLFTEDESEEGESELQKANLSKIKLKIPTVFGKDNKKHKQVKRRHSVAAHASKVVQETPCRKQVHNTLWQKQHRARKRTSTVTDDLNVVMESPLKEIIKDENLPRRSPRRHPGSIFQRSTSFYGENAKSCPLVRTKSFTSAIQPETPKKKLDLDADPVPSEENTTDLNNATTTTHSKDTIKSLKESTIRVSPRKRNRFSLHNLLTSTEVSKNMKSKALTPKKDVPVRSSPRLLKKRSFSFIGFSNTSRLERTTSSESASGVTNKAVTPNKRILLTPTRASPRLKRKDEDVSTQPQPVGESASSSGITSKVTTPKKIIILTPTKSCTRSRRKDDDLPTQPQSVEEDSTFEQLQSKPENNCSLSRNECVSSSLSRARQTHWTPTRSSSRAKKDDDNSATEFHSFPNKNFTSEPSNEGNSLFPSPDRQLTRRTLLRTPTRSSPRFKEKSNKMSSTLRSPNHVQQSPTFKKQIVKPLLFADLPNNERENSTVVDDGDDSLRRNDSVLWNNEQKKNRKDDLAESCSNPNESTEEHSITVKNRRFNLSLSKGKKRQLKSSRRENEEAPSEIQDNHRENSGVEDCNEGDIPDTGRVLRSNEKKRRAKRSLDSLKDGIDGDPVDSRTESSNVSSRVLRSNQKKRRATRSLDSLRDVSSPSPCSKSSDLQVFRSSSDVGESKESSTSRKRLSFSPKAKSKRATQKTRVSHDEQTTRIKNIGENNSKNGLNDEVNSGESSESNDTKSTRTSKQERKQHCSHVVDGQRLLASKPPVVATPPRKRRKTQAHQENKRSSPLNQILKQRKRNRPEAFKSPRPKKTIIEQCEQTEEEMNPFGKSRIPIDLDDCSKSSEDMMFDWFQSIQKNNAPETSVSEDKEKDNVEGRDSGEDVDNVFETTRRTKPKPYKPSTPISAKSLKALQESPILVQTGAVSLPHVSLNKRLSDPSPDEVCARLTERLKRRKRSEALAQSSANEDGDIESISFRNSKRLKLESS